MKIFFLLSITSAFLLPSAFAVQSYPTGVSVILFTPQTTEYDEGQQVTLVGQITQMGGSTGTGEQITNVPYATYSIIDTDTGYVITTGQANYQGEFEYVWNATIYGGYGTVHLAAASLGSESNPILLQIYPVVNSPSYSPAYSTVPEFPITLQVLLIAIVSIIVFYRIKLIKFSF